MGFSPMVNEHQQSAEVYCDMPRFRCVTYSKFG